MELSSSTISIIIIAGMILLYMSGGFICGIFCSRRIHTLDSPRDNIGSDNVGSDNELIDVSNTIIEVSHRIIEIKNIEIVKAFHETNSVNIDLPEANMI